MSLRVGHVGLQVTDLERSIDHAERILGLRVSERDGDTAYLTCNERHHELILRKGPSVGCDHLAFELFEPDELAALRERVERAGLRIVGEGPQERGIADAFRFLAPGGFVIEAFHGMATDEPAHYDTGGARPRKFEHITVKCSQKQALEDVFTGIVGLRVSDRAEDQMVWMRASEEHHGVNVIRADVDQLHHYAWQVDDFAAIGRTGDHLMRHGKTFLWGPGHHGIGDNYFCYFFDDDGAVVEYSGAIQRIENEHAYVPRTWPDEPLTVNRWGNPPPPPDFFPAGIPLVPPAA